jgi:putative DNA primase/helicase
MPTESEIDQWEEDFPSANIGLPAGPANGLGFLDIDSFTPEVLAAWRSLIGHVPISRIGQKGFVVPVRWAGQTLNKLPYRGLPLAEFLGLGRQVAAIGPHPDTGLDYRWEGGSPLELSRDEMVSLAIDLDDSKLRRLEMALGEMRFTLDPRDQAKGSDASGLVGVGGRNNALKAQVGAAYSKGKDLDTIVSEIVHFDRLQHREPLFESSEYPGGSPDERARAFVTNISRSITTERLERGVALPEPLTVERETLVERVTEAAETGSRAMPNLQVSDKGVPVANFYNATQVLRTSGLDLWYDEFFQRIRCVINGVTREWTDADDLNLLHYIQSDAGIQRMPLHHVQHAVEWFANSHPRHGPLTYFNSLEWDGCCRIERFFTDYFGADDNEYVHGVSTNFWLGMVARVLKPGCKLDNMVVIEGEQGIGKSSALDIIGGEWYGVAHHQVGSLDFLQGLAGKLITEMAELDAMSKADNKTVKAMLSTRKDSYRASYGRRVKDYARQGIFVGTTNEHEYLDDSTGGRRFWPVLARSIDLKAIVRDRDQLFAEAVCAMRGGAVHWTDPVGAVEVQETRLRHNSWEEPIRKWFDDQHETHHTLAQIARGALGMEAGRIDKRTEMRLASTLRALKMVKQDTMYKNLKGKFWSLPENTSIRSQDVTSDEDSP